MLPDCPGETDCLSKELEKEEARESTSYSGQYICQLSCKERHIEVTSWLVSADDFSSRVARGANERVSAANE